MTVPLDSPPPPPPPSASSNSNSGGEITVLGGGGSKSPWPPGFRFHPTDEELALYYLKRKIRGQRIKPNIIREIDVYKCEPWELPGKSVLQTGDKQWYFFSPRDRKYPNGSRSNRGTKYGYWKATGKDRSISHKSRTVGAKKTLVFYNGRAPKGKRTNWVMHEYSLDKEELNMCNAVQDSFALYKVYQKSGSGPKNGEEYSAPFREEEWLDDDDDPVNENLGIPCNDEPEESDLFGSYDQFAVDDVGKALQQILDEPEANQQHFNTFLREFEVDGENSTQSFMVEPSFREAISCEPAEIPHPCELVGPGQTSFPGSATSIVQPSEAVDFPYDLDWAGLDPSRIDGDFVELNDLNDQEPTALSLQNINNDLLSHGIGRAHNQDPSGLCLLDINNDLLSHGIGRAHNQDPSGLCLLDINNDLLSHDINKLCEQEPSAFSLQDISNDFLSHNMSRFCETDIYFDAPTFLSEEIVPLDCSATGVASQLDHQFLHHSAEENHQPYVTSQLWAHEKLNVFSPPQSSQVLLTPPNSGGVYNGHSTNLSGGTQGQGSIVGNASESWVTSAVYSLLDSIPANPASATENALINRAFERMSSFGVARNGTRDTSSVDGIGATPRRREGRNGGILFVSFLGALVAIVWVLMVGTTLKALKAFVGKFIAS